MSRKRKDKTTRRYAEPFWKIGFLKEEMQLIADVGTDDPYLTAFLKYRNIQTLNRGIIVELIKAIWVHENREITIDFNFADEYQRIID